MTLSGKELASMTPREIERRFALRCGCGNRIEEHPDEAYRIDGRRVCGDCYFIDIGREVEEYPIYNPERKR